MTPDYGLLCPFLTDAPEFAAGVRLGMLLGEVSRLPARRRKYVEMVRESDEEQVRLLMHRLGWGVSRRQVLDPPEWIIITFRRRPEATRV